MFLASPKIVKVLLTCESQAQFPHGVGYGNFSIAEGEGEWIMVDMTSGAPGLANLFQWIINATQDGTVTKQEFDQAITIVKALA
jgi:hypothetical protein